MDFFIDIIESTAMFLETKAKFFMSINNKDEEKKRKKIFFYSIYISNYIRAIRNDVLISLYNK